MLEPLPLNPRNRKWIRIALFTGLLVIVAGCVGIFVLFRDPDQAKAIALFDALIPGMHVSEMHELLDKSQIKLAVFESTGTFRIGDRFYTVVNFDEQEHLVGKHMREWEHKRPQLPFWMKLIAWQLGYTLDGLQRDWP